MALPEPSAWRAEMIRFSFFYAEAQDAKGRGWWSAVTGVEPEATLNRPQVGEYSEAGGFRDGHLEMKVTLNRVDWILSFPFASIPDAQMLSTYESLAQELRDRIAGWIRISPLGVIRVAYGSVLLHSVSNPVAGNEMMIGYLPFIGINPATTTDFFVQLNYVRPAYGNTDIEINDLTKWGVLTGQFMQIGLSGMPGMSLNHMVRAEFDTSTSAVNSKVINQDALLIVFEGMVGNSISVLMEGVKQEC